MLGLKSVLALAVSKGVMAALRLLGRGGSAFPGRVARTLDPDLLRHLARQHSNGNTVVTGTNGKTTTSRILFDMLTQTGHTPAYNRSGSNLIAGITSAAVENSTLLGSMRTDTGLFEVDEATMSAGCRQLQPTIALVTNFFRDQVDRFGDTQDVLHLVEKGLSQMPRGGTIITNADDPLAARVGLDLGHFRLYYGIEDRSIGALGVSKSFERHVCPVCGSEYEYSVLFYAHLGHYFCPACGNRRPDAGVRLTRYERLSFDESLLTIETCSQQFRLGWNLPGLYNAYNALAAVAFGVRLGLAQPAVESAVSSMTPPFGRMEAISVLQRTVVMALVKNAAGFTEVVRTILEDQSPKHLLIAVNANAADGRDTGWLQEADFESLAGAKANIERVTVSGVQAEKAFGRLVDAGISPTVLVKQPNAQKALMEAITGAPFGSTLYVLPTYTAMTELRQALHERGFLKSLWDA